MLYLCELYVNGKLWDYGVFETEYKALCWVMLEGRRTAMEKNSSWDYYISEYTEG